MSKITRKYDQKAEISKEEKEGKKNKYTNSKK